jgi:hypothetical protein
LVEAAGAAAPARIVEWRASRPEGMESSVTVMRANGSAAWFFAITTSARIEVSESRYRTAEEAKRGAESAYWAKRAEESAAEAASNYSAARRAGNEAGRAHFAGVQAGTMARPESSSWSQNSLGEFARRASAAHCGVFHGPRRNAYETGYRAGYRDAEFMAGRDAEEIALENESAEEFAARRGRIAGRKDSGSGAPREGRIEHLSYLDGIDSKSEKESFRAGYLATFQPVKGSR